MVGMPGSEEAARIARDSPALSIGLHAWFGERAGDPAGGVSNLDAFRTSLDAQLTGFTELTGGPPTHLDSHHHVHTRHDLLPHFHEAAARFGIPLRGCSRVRYCSRFYGQWAGEHHPEQVSVESLIEILATQIRDGVTELGCHPGFADPSLVSSYTVERELELRTLCDDRVRRFLDSSGLALASFEDLERPHRSSRARSRA
jgi:predicted glycoside hydrolase/deacetylase ChbG (UPF0249 family)